MSQKVGHAHPMMPRFQEDGYVSVTPTAGIVPGQLGVEPYPGVGPVALGRNSGDPQHTGGFFDREPGEVAELDKLGLDRVLGREPLEGLVDGEDDISLVAIVLTVRDLDVVERYPMPASSILTGTPPTGMFDQDPPHSLRHGGEEMGWAVPVLGLHRLHEAEIGLIDQGRGLEGLPRLLPGHELAAASRCSSS